MSAKIKVEDLPVITELVAQGIGLTIDILKARAEAEGKTEITIEDLRSTRIELSHELRSGRTVGELLERVKGIAAEGK